MLMNRGRFGSSAEGRRFGVLFSGGFLLQHKGGWDSWEMYK